MSRSMDGSKEEFVLVAELKECTKKKDLFKGTRLHAIIRKRGWSLDNSPYLASTLINMYATCGVLEKAQEVHDHLRVRSVVSWNSLISGYAKQGKGREALDCFRQMRSEGMCPNIVTFLSTLKACGGIGAIEMGEQIHYEIIGKGLLENNVSLGTALIDMYSKCGMLRKAQLVHRKLCVQDVISWSALIAGYVEHDEGHEALQCFKQMRSEGISPNSVTFTLALKACSVSGAIDEGSQIHDEIIRRGLLEEDTVLATALVDMYARCGMFGKAHETLENLHVCSIVSWNALVAGYVYHGRFHEAINCLECMRSEGLSPDAVTFISILKACGTLGAINIGKQIHNEIINRDLMDENNVLVNALLDMYARCFLLADAQQVHDALPVRDVVSWTTLIAGYVQQGLDCEALDCFESMQNEKVSPNAVTYSYILKACGSVRATEKGKQIHSEIMSRDLLKNDNMLGNALVDMYAKCGLMAKAQQVLEELSVRDVISWSALIAGYAQEENVHQALVCFKKMQDEDISPNSATYASILKACGSARALSEGKQIHDEIVRKGFFLKDIVIGNALVDMYAKCGLLAKAQFVLEELPERDVVTWSALIAGYAEQGLGHDALNCFEQMQYEGILPNLITLICILKACGSIGAFEKGKQIYHETFRNGCLEKTPIIGTALMDMYAKCGFPEKAQCIHNDLCVRDVISWNALISGYVAHGQSHEALKCFEEMQNEGLSPDASTFLCILKACCSIGAIEIGERVHHEILIKGLVEKDVVLTTALMDMYAKCGVLSKAQQVHDNMPFHDTVSFSSLIAGYAEHAQSNEALNYFEWMQSEGYSPNAVTFVAILKVCGNIGAIEKGREIHDYSLNKGLLKDNVILSNALIGMYAKCGALVKAKQILEELPARDVISWSSLIAGYAQQGLCHEALDCFEQMQLDGVSPDAITFLCVLNACCQSGLVNNARTYYENMSRKFNITPNLEHHTCMVVAFGNAGLLDKSVSIIKMMQCSYYFPVWLALLGACEKWGNVKLGKLAFEQAIHLDIYCAPAYALMASIYIAAGMQDDADEIESFRLKNTKHLQHGANYDRPLPVHCLTK